MNTRTAIQAANTPVVLGISFSLSHQRFVTALSDGFRVFRTDNCLSTYQPSLPTHAGVTIVAALDDKYVAFVGGGRSSTGHANVVVFWDCELDREVTRFDFYEPVLGLRLNGKWMVVILHSRAVVFEHQKISTRHHQALRVLASDDGARTSIADTDHDIVCGPNRVKSVHTTAPNPYALASLSESLLILPAQTLGQVQLVPLPGGSKRVLRAHNTALRQVALSPIGNLLATSSEQGTLIRVFDTKTFNQLAEFRRGVDRAVIHGLAFSESGRWLAVTSDKGTLHVFDLQPTAMNVGDIPKGDAQSTQHHRKRLSNPIHRLSIDPEKESVSGRSSPSTVTSAHHGSIQEYYGLRPPPASATPTGRDAAASAISAFKSSAMAPRIFKDVRSVASISTYTGSDPPHWQGGASHSWTTAPGGTRKRVKNPVHALPADPSGRPPKGVVAFAGRSPGVKDEHGATIYVLGGGSDARWEQFELLPANDGGWLLVNRGFRKYLTKQFAE